MGNNADISISKPRNATADILKGLLIICVIFGHSLTMVNSLRGVAWSDFPFNVFITTFEIPFFILISGYFLFFSLRNKDYKYGVVLKKRISNMIPPLLLWEAIPFILVSMFSKEKMGIGEWVIGLYDSVFSDKLWFISSYLCCTIVLCLIQAPVTAIKNRKMAVLTEILLILGVIILCHLSRLSFGFTTYLVLFAIIGFLISKYALLSCSITKYFIIIFAGIFFILYPFYGAQDSFYLYPQYILPFDFHKFFIVLFRFLVSISACCLIFMMVVLLCRNEKPKVSFDKTIGFLGRRSLELYILSMYIQSLMIILISKIITTNNIYLSDFNVLFIFGPLFFIVLICICLMVDKLLSYFPKLHLLLLGR